jgi:predicted nucleic-acid-binding Zn-ribbon protein
MIKETSFTCVKCQSNKFEVGQIRAAGGFWGKLFNVQNKKYDTLSCKDCGYTEIYSRSTSAGSNIIDFFLGS